MHIHYDYIRGKIPGATSWLAAIPPCSVRIGANLTRHIDQGVVRHYPEQSCYGFKLHDSLREKWTSHIINFVLHGECVQVHNFYTTSDHLRREDHLCTAISNTATLHETTICPGTCNLLVESCRHSATHLQTVGPGHSTLFMFTIWLLDTTELFKKDTGLKCGSSSWTGTF